jgi:hypothetical protein
VIACGVRGVTAFPLALMRRVFVVIAVFCLLAPAGALASKAGGKRLIEDCRPDGEINGHYTQADFDYALSHIPSDLNAYTNCEDAIRAARRAAAGAGPKGSGGAGGGGASGAPPASPAPAPAPSGPTPGEKRAIDNASRSSGTVNVGGGPPISPGGPGVTTTSFTRAVPGPMLVVLVLLLLGALAAAGPAIRSRVLARRQG